MKVSELPYKRRTIEEAASVMEDVLRRIREAANADEVLAAREDYLALLEAYMTAGSLAYTITPSILPLPCSTRPSAPSWRKSSRPSFSARWRSGANR